LAANAEGRVDIWLQADYNKTMTMKEIVYLLGLLGIAAFAATGVMANKGKPLDVFAIVITGMIAALGGGTVRDVLLGIHPLLWIADQTYLWVALIASLATFALARKVVLPLKALLIADACGLALFTVLTTQKVVVLGFSGAIAVLMGVITGIAGGTIRDLLVNEIPLVLRRELYATPALMGAAVYILLSHFFPNQVWCTLTGIAIVLIVRLAALQWNLYYPDSLIYKSKSSE
jgi:uncharacterized membrane protein YeiH